MPLRLYFLFLSRGPVFALVDGWTLERVTRWQSWPWVTMTTQQRLKVSFGRHSSIFSYEPFVHSGQTHL